MASPGRDDLSASAERAPSRLITTAARDLSAIGPLPLPVAVAEGGIVEQGISPDPSLPAQVRRLIMACRVIPSSSMIPAMVETEPRHIF